MLPPLSHQGYSQHKGGRCFEECRLDESNTAVGQHWRGSGIKKTEAIEECLQFKRGSLRLLTVTIIQYSCQGRLRFVKMHGQMCSTVLQMLCGIPATFGRFGRQVL